VSFTRVLSANAKVEQLTDKQNKFHRYLMKRNGQKILWTKGSGGGQYQKWESLSSVAASSLKNYSAARPPGLHQIFQFLLGDITPLFHQGTVHLWPCSAVLGILHYCPCSLFHFHAGQR